MKKNINRKSLVVLIGLLMVFSASLFVLPIRASPKPKTSAPVDLTIIMLGAQQMPGVENVTDDFALSPLSAGVGTVTVISSGVTTDEQLTTLQTLMQAGTATAHVIALDTPWTASFVKNGWLANLDTYLDPNEMDDYGSGIVVAGQYQGSQYAYPYFMNLGVLYYRTDLLDLHKPGWTVADFDTWEELNATANFILNNQSGLLTAADADLVGYTAQFDSYEGGVVNFFEWAGSNGILDVVTTAGDVNIDTPELKKVMDFLKALIAPQWGGVQGSDYIIPHSGLVTDEASSGNTWLANRSIFLRQWPYIYSLSETNNVEFGIAPLPHFAGATGYKTSVVGGAILAVPAATTGTARQAAVNLTKFLGDTLAQESELTADIDAVTPGVQAQGNFPALISVFASPPAGFAWIQGWTAQAALTLSRPVHPDYPLISNSIAGYLSDILGDRQTVADGLKDMDRDVTEIIHGAPAEPAIPGYSIAILIISAASAIGIVIIARKKLR